MLYKPNKKEIEQIKGLNKGYKLIMKGLENILKNLPKADKEISVYVYRASKNIDCIIKRTARLLEAKYIDRQFLDIVKKFNRRK